MHLWERILYQAHFTLNTLRHSIHNPNISDHAMMEGNFDFNKTPLAPPGTNVIVNEKPNRRRTWGQDRIQVWYIGPAVEHYYCYKVYISNTRVEYITDTVELFPENTTMPGIFSADVAIHVVTDLIRALKNPAPAALFAPLRTGQKMHLDNRKTYSKDKS